jgi:protein BUR2
MYVTPPLALTVLTQHKQIASVAIYLASKIEEHARKLKEIVIACCRVAQKNENLVVDEQTKDYWRWRDTIQLHEDYMLELLCFDLTIEGPHIILKELITKYNVYHNRELRDTAWAFINDSAMTPLCLLYPARTIAAAALYCAAKRSNVAFPDDERGRPWWETEGVKGLDMRKTYNCMAEFYEKTPNLTGTPDGLFVRSATPLDVDERFAKTRLRRGQVPASPEQPEVLLREVKREKRSSDRDDTPHDGEPPVKRVRSETPPTASVDLVNGRSARDSEVSEEGEVDE